VAEAEAGAEVRGPTHSHGLDILTPPLGPVFFNRLDAFVDASVFITREAPVNRAVPSLRVVLRGQGRGGDAEAPGIIRLY
jgi:hypothetical protein